MSSGAGVEPRRPSRGATSGITVPVLSHADVYGVKSGASLEKKSVQTAKDAHLGTKALPTKTKNYLTDHHGSVDMSN